MDEAFGDRLKRLRAAVGMTQEELGQIVGVSAAAVGHWETGKNDPPAQMLRRIADYFGVTADFLLGRNEILPSAYGAYFDADMTRVLFRVTRQLSPEALREVRDFIEFKRNQERRLGRAGSGADDESPDKPPASPF